MSKRPYGFIHNLKLPYYCFSIDGHTWFYAETDYSKEFRERNSWKFDGQFFYKSTK